MTLDRVIKRLKQEYEHAQRQSWINKPLAYALYEVWKYVNMTEKDRSESNE